MWFVCSLVPGWRVYVDSEVGLGDVYLLWRFGAVVTLVGLIHLQNPGDGHEEGAQWCEADLLHIHGGENQDWGKDRIVGGFVVGLW